MEPITWQAGGKLYTFGVPSAEDVMATLNPPPAEACLPSDVAKECIAWGGAVYAGVPPKAYDSHRYLAMQMAWDYGAGNIWILPSKPRLPYPYAQLYAVASMFKTEGLAGRKADWLLWIDDDVVVPRHIVRVLRAAADPDKRPVMAVIPPDRHPPFYPAAWDLENRRWSVPPSSGVHQVGCIGWCALLIHRSVFDRVPQPWWVALPGLIAQGESDRPTVVNPDTWFSQQCIDHGVPLHVCCDVRVTHLGEPLEVSPETAIRMQQSMGLVGQSEIEQAKLTGLPSFIGESSPREPLSAKVKP